MNPDRGRVGGRTRGADPTRPDSRRTWVNRRRDAFHPPVADQSPLTPAAVPFASESATVDPLQADGAAVRARAPQAAAGHPAGSRACWVALAGTLSCAVLAAAVPALRSPLAVLAPWAAVLLVLAGVIRFRPQPSTSWLLIALMIALWAIGTTVVFVQERVSRPTDGVVGLGQFVAVVVTVRLLRNSGHGSREPRDSGARLDLLILGIVLGLVGAQLIGVLARSGGDRATVSLVVPFVDVAITGLLARVLLARARPEPAVLLVMSAALASIVYDMLAQLDGHRLALPGTADQVLGIGCLLLFGVAALHPTMTSLFSAEAFVLRRASASLLGLLPLVLVPLALWQLARSMGTPGLPTPVLLVACCAVAGLCLVRGAAVLRLSEHLADHDALTDLLNRRGLARAFAANAPAGGWALILIDIDEFKRVNDSHGHDVGDALLLVVRGRLLDATGGGEVVARLGGDEFVVLVESGRAEAAADEILRCLRQPVLIQALDLRASASIGVALGEGAVALSDVLTRADIAMYAAKAAGRDGVVVYHPQMKVDVAHEFALSGQLRQLLGTGIAGAGRLEVQYQPLVDIRTGTAVGAEALVRWRHPQLGLLPPADFLGLVNSSGLDARLDSTVLDQVLADIASWQRQGRRVLPISFNVTGASLMDGGLADRILTALAASGIASSLLHVELTEYEQLPDLEVVTRNLVTLDDAGVDLHLDDYGTGYSSLDYLYRFPIKLLKLDRSVVSSVTTDQVALVAGIAAMARTMGLQILAEGIETEQQRERLGELGIRLGQGWLFSRALSESEYRTWLPGIGPGTPVDGVFPAAAIPA